MVEHQLVCRNSSYLGIIAVRLDSISTRYPSQPDTKLERMTYESDL